MLSFSAMEQKFGTAAAYHYLTEIEKAAHICSSSVADLDPEIRLAIACEAQDGASDFSNIAA